MIVPCASTADTTVGSTCSITTTANTIAPGAAVEGKRAIWETGQVRVSDGGADGDPATADGDGPLPRAGSLHSVTGSKSTRVARRV